MGASCLILGLPIVLFVQMYNMHDGLKNADAAVRIAGAIAVHQVWVCLWSYIADYYFNICDEDDPALGTLNESEEVVWWQKIAIMSKKDRVTAVMNAVGLNSIAVVQIFFSPVPLAQWMVIGCIF